MIHLQYFLSRPVYQLVTEELMMLMMIVMMVVVGVLVVSGDPTPDSTFE
jgi:hypothetical protein